MRFPITVLGAALISLCIPAVSQVSVASQANAPSAIGVPMVPDGTPVRMRVIRMVSSESDRPGEQVEFELIENVTVGDRVLMAQGSSVWGKVTVAAPADHVTNQPGVLEIRVDGLRLSSGQLLPLRNLKEIPMDANADVTPEKLANLVNSPYGPFARFTRSPEVTIPKNTYLTLFIAADVPLSATPKPVAKQPSESTEPASGSVAGRIVGNPGSTRSLGDIAREQRQKGMIGKGMTTNSGKATLNND